jgi:hypothetical protein
MAVQLKNPAGTYRLLYFQPDPEDGERVCVAVLVAEKNRFSVLYDRKFPKLHCLAPETPSEIVKYCLDELESSLIKLRDDQLSSALARLSPQMSASEPRQLAVPLSEPLRLRLLERFVLARRPSQAEQRPTRAEQTSNERLVQFVQDMGGLGSQLSFNVPAREIVGRELPNTRPIAVAVRTQSNIVLVDGVDLNALTPAAAVAKVNRVVHTFWQYGRVRESELWPIKRIGVVMNGHVPRTSSYEDAHEYALHQFEKDSDVTVDTTSGSGIESLEFALKQ